MILIYINLDTKETYYYLSRFDGYKYLGEKNIFGDILIGILLVSYIEYKLIPCWSGFSAEFTNYLMWEKRKGREETSNGSSY